LRKALLMCTMVFGLSWLTPAFCASPRGDASPNVPQTQAVQYGVASWYGDREQGHLMACGEPFDEYALTAAHRSLPMGTVVAVTNLHNGRSVRVRIKDRGPMVQGRVIDLSKGAAMRLGFVHKGLTSVKVQVVSLPHKEPTRTARLQVPPLPY
jgi:rare lipoprotein A